MLTSGVLIAVTGYDPDVDYAAMDDPEITLTGTPADNFPDNQRTTFCNSVEMQSQLSIFKNI